MKLFESFDLHGLKLNNRLVMAPMTRSRANAEGLQAAIAAEYYRQRSGAGLIVTEATAVSKQGCGYPMIPGIWNETQMTSWLPIPKAVHEAGGKIFIQLFHTGRISHSSLTGAQPVSSSDVPPLGKVMSADFQMNEYETPRPLEVKEIPGVVQQFRVAAENAKKAGFDGIEIHAANGYLIDQFIRNGVNKRTDDYGGKPENRIRFLREIVEAVIAGFGANRVGVRLSPYSGFNSMSDSAPMETFSAAAEMLNKYSLAYLHMMEPIGIHPMGADASLPRVSIAVRKIYKGVLIVNGGLDQKIGEHILQENQADLICFGVPFIANPDLVERFRKGQPLAQADQSTFYTGGPKGYIDYSEFS